MQKNTHGGRREGSGKPSFFRGKSASAEEPLYGKVPPAITLRLSKAGRARLTAHCKRLSKEFQSLSKNKKATVSRNVFIEALIHIYGEHLSFDQIVMADRAQQQ